MGELNEDGKLTLLHPVSGAMVRLLLATFVASVHSHTNVRVWESSLQSAATTRVSYEQLVLSVGKESPKCLGSPA